MSIRYSLPHDRAAIIEILQATRFFYEDEIAVAAEVLDDALAKGPHGDYQSLVFEDETVAGAGAAVAATAGGTVLGWVCFGAAPCTQGTFDVYWLAVSPAAQGRGIGRALMSEAKSRIAAAGGRLVLVETSGRAAYAPTRAFYQRIGYEEAARIADFYAPGDDKVIYVKRL